jgi:hypothetical protein
MPDNLNKPIDLVGGLFSSRDPIREHQDRTIFEPDGGRDIC